AEDGIRDRNVTGVQTCALPIYGWISFELGAALVLGENIGTTITANLAALTGNTQARRAALAHLVFNVFGVIWVLCLFTPFTEARSEERRVGIDCRGCLAVQGGR